MSRFLFSTFLVTACLPGSIAFSIPPDSSFYNTAAAVLGWSVVLLSTGWALNPQRDSVWWMGPVAALSTVALMGVGEWLLAMGVLCLFLGAGIASRHIFLRLALTGLFGGYALAALAALAVCSVQFFLPNWPDNLLLAASQTSGRAVGNLRQPNLQATLLIWGAVAAAWLAAQHTRLKPIFPIVLTGIMFSVALTGSRTGMVLSGLLMIWGGADRMLPRTVRWSLGSAPLLLGASVLALSWWTSHIGGTYFLETRAQSGSDISSSRFAIWSNALELISAEPWAGVGWGDFNFAWTLTPFQKRPVAFFDHTHNLLLQLAVELGIPAAVAICCGFLWLSWRARAAVVCNDPAQAGMARAVVVMLAAVLFHSLLEYPLRYSYFLLPSAFLWGLYLGLGCLRPDGIMEVSPGSAGKRIPLGMVLSFAGLAMLLGSLFAMWDYQRIVQIFAPHGSASSQPLAERIREGRRSSLFGAHADYAAATMAARPSEAFKAFERPLHRLIDARLMIAYARALDERGERDKAVYVAQRLREFRHPLGDQFFAPCEVSRPPGERPPFQCDTTPVHLSFRDFRSPFH